jgi:hypothetical protein
MVGDTINIFIETILIQNKEFNIMVIIVIVPGESTLKTQIKVIVI